MTFIILGFAFIPLLQLILIIFNTRQEFPISIDRSTTVLVRFFVMSWPENQGFFYFLFPKHCK